MPWHLWFVQVWLLVMLGLSVPGFLSYENLRNFLENLNEAVGAAAAMILIFVVHGMFFGISGMDVILLLTIVTGVSLFISVLSDIFRSPEDVRESEERVGEAARDAVTQAREDGASLVEAGLEGAAAAEEEKSWDLAGRVIGLALLIPNLVAFVLGLRTLFGS